MGLKVYGRQGVTCNGRPAFYAAIYDDIREIAMKNGWAMALHGSLAVCAGKARSGEVRSLEISEDILKLAVENTVKLIDDMVEVENG